MARPQFLAHNYSSHPTDSQPEKLQIICYYISTFSDSALGPLGGLGGDEKCLFVQEKRAAN